MKKNPWKKLAGVYFGLWDWLFIIMKKFMTFGYTGNFVTKLANDCMACQIISLKMWFLLEAPKSGNEYTGCLGQHDSFEGNCVMEGPSIFCTYRAIAFFVNGVKTLPNKITICQYLNHLRINEYSSNFKGHHYF